MKKPFPLQVVKCECGEDYQVRLEFNTGEVGTVDLRPELEGEVFKMLGDPLFFRQIRLNPETNTVEWPNGADLAPEYLLDLVRTSKGKNRLTIDRGGYAQ